MLLIVIAEHFFRLVKIGSGREFEIPSHVFCDLSGGGRRSLQQIEKVKPRIYVLPAVSKITIISEKKFLLSWCSEKWPEK